MDLIRLGRAHRAIRIHLGRRQADVALVAGVRQQVVSDLECGRAGTMTLDLVEKLLSAVDARVYISVVWRGAELDRLLDEGHAAIGGTLAEQLVVDGWQVLPEVTYSVFGERGSIDLLAWHAATRTLLVIEIKTEITSAEEMLRRHDAKVRLASGIGFERFGVRPATVARLLAVAESTGNRNRVARLGALLSAAYPLRGAAVRDWLAAPNGPMGGILFLNTAPSGAKGRPVRPMRVRQRPAPASAGRAAPNRP
jgi:transcriptional regulator with XRE-family HTH domain